MIGVIILTLTLSTGALVAASTQTVTREITYGINVMLNGEIVRFYYDTRPFVMGGRTFLPLRTLAELLEMSVDFDSVTNTAIVGSRYAGPMRRPLTQAAPSFDNGGPTGNVNGTAFATVDSVSMGGVTYQNALRFSCVMMTLFAASERYRFSLHNLNGQFRVLTGYVGRVDGSSMGDATIRFIGDGHLLEEHSLRAADMPIPISIFVEGITQLRIEVIFPPINASIGTRYAVVGFLE